MKRTCCNGFHEQQGQHHLGTLIRNNCMYICPMSLRLDDRWSMVHRLLVRQLVCAIHKMTDYVRIVSVRHANLNNVNIVKMDKF